MCRAFLLPLRLRDQSSGGADPASTRPGVLAREQGLRKDFPVVLIPGATTTGLEIWSGKLCAKASFKQRLWGSMSMFSSLASMDTTCWLEHMSLNQTTGLDPDGIKVRPAEGLSNVEYFMPGFWIWAQIVESLADIGYDTSDLYAQTYDWRLSPRKSIGLRIASASAIRSGTRLSPLCSLAWSDLLVPHLVSLVCFLPLRLRAA